MGGGVCVGGVWGGKLTWDRDEWAHAADDWVKSRCSLSPSESPARQAHRMARLEMLAEWSLQHGPGQPDGGTAPTHASLGIPGLDSPWRLSMAALGEAKAGNTAGGDLVTAEMTWALSDWARLTICNAMWEYLVSSRRARPRTWQKLLLVAMQKFCGADSLEYFRTLALMAFCAKWLMRVVTMLTDMCLAALPPSRVRTYGFTPGISKAAISALVRQLMWLGTVWRKDVIVVSADVYHCFAEVDPAVVQEAMETLQLPYWLVRAVMREWEQLTARIRVLDADWGEEIPFRYGAKTGSTEAPLLLNILWRVYGGPLVRSWEQRGFGVGRDDEGGDPAEQTTPVTHALWADNLFLAANSWEEAQIMLTETTDMLKNRMRMRWKPSSLEVMARRGLAPKTGAPLGCMIDGSWTRVNNVTVMSVLGDTVSNCGGTTEAVEARRRQGTGTYYKHATALTDRAQPMKLRVEALGGGAQGGMCLSGGNVGGQRERPEGPPEVGERQAPHDVKAPEGTRRRPLGAHAEDGEPP